MTDEGSILVTVVIEKCDEVTRQVFNVIVCYFSRTGWVAITPLVRDDDMLARCGKGWYLMAPGKGMLWPAVTEYNRFSCILQACFKDFEFHTVDRYKSGLGKIGRIKINYVCHFYVFKDWLIQTYAWQVTTLWQGSAKINGIGQNTLVKSNCEVQSFLIEFPFFEFCPIEKIEIPYANDTMQSNTNFRHSILQTALSICSLQFPPY